MTDANGVMVTNTFDNLNRVLTRGYPDGGVERFGYSAVGLIAYTNQINLTNYYAYDAAGRKLYETNANQELLQFQYNPSGDLTNLIDGKSQSTKWNYDQFGRVTNKLDQAGTVVLKYFYDADDRLTNRWSVAKGTTYYTNDAVGNLTYIKYPASTSVSLQYDWLNRLTNMVDAAGTTKYTYTAGDPYGLTIYYCVRKSDLGLGSNHGYFYDPSRNPPSCGQSASSGGGHGRPLGNPTHDKGPDDPTEACWQVPGTDSDSDLANSLWQCCQNTANQGTWVPGINDCFNKIDDCLTANNIHPPNSNRFGPPHLEPVNGPPIFSPIRLEAQR